jgi:hypothetical protein
VLWLVIGLAPLAPFVSGILMWWNRSLSKWFRRRAPVVPSLEPAPAMRSAPQGLKIPVPSSSATRGMTHAAVGKAADGLALPK